MFGILVIGGLAFYSGSAELFQGRFVKDPLPAYDENKCYDSDGGKNYEYAGTIYGKISRSKFGNKTDVCATRTKVKEYFCDGKFIQSEEYACENGCSAGACKLGLKSDFFKNDSEAKVILLGQSYNMDELGLITNQTDINKEVFAYKLFSAFKMLGYKTDRGYNIVGDKPHLLVLNQFQAENGFSESNFVGKEVLLKIDANLYEKDQFVKGFADDFPLYEHIGNLHENDISKDHWAYLYYYPITVLPDWLQFKTLPQYIFCFAGQCGLKLDGYTGDYDNPGDFVIYDEALSTEGSNLFVLDSDMAKVNTFLHEYSHQLDKLNKGVVNEYLMTGVIDTEEFYAISYDKISDDLFRPCYKMKSDMNVYDFISDYAMSEGISIGCPEGSYFPSEDFAESFASYVTSGKDFRAATGSSSVLLQKYNWLKNNVFEGVEYDTSVSHGNASGCNDLPELSYQTPGYLKCDEEYVWDGKLPEL